jgi:uncharacterized membrane protein YhhN
MNIPVFCVLLAYAAASVYDTVAAGSGRKRVVKPLLMPLLFLLCCVYWQDTDREFVYPLLCGIFFGWLGDVLLLQKGEVWFAGGLLSFLLGHISYAAGFLSRASAHLRTSQAAAAAAVYAGVLIITAFRLVPVSPKKLKVPVVVYMTAILFMSYTALLFAAASSQSGVLSFAGSLAFVISDLILYVGVLRGKSDGAAVMGTYTAAQLLIALGILL